MRFTKMHGCRATTLLCWMRWSSRSALRRRTFRGWYTGSATGHTGVGADGVMVLQGSATGADVAMRFYNSDGSLGEMCGNGARCVCRYACECGYAGDTVRVETTAGLVTGWRQSRDRFRIRLNTPTV